MNIYLFLHFCPLLPALFLFPFISILSCISCSLILGVLPIFSFILFYGYNQRICCGILLYVCVCVFVCLCVLVCICQPQQKHCLVLHFITTNHATSCTLKEYWCVLFAQSVNVYVCSVCVRVRGCVCERTHVCVHTCMCVCAYVNVNYGSQYNNCAMKQHGGCV